jgi:Flp pilus assembly protein CpaB
MTKSPFPGLGPRTPSRRSEPEIDDDADGQDGRRTARSRPGLPSGRAVVGGLLVTVAALVVFAAYAGATTGPTRTAMTVRADLPAGHRLSSDDLERVAVDLPPRTTSATFDDIDALVGAVTLAPLSAGDLVQRSAILPGGEAGTPRHEFSFPVERERAVNGSLRAGESVDILATFGSGPDAYTVVLARPATVVAVQDGGRGGLSSGAGLVLTVGLGSAEQVLDVAHASQVAALTVVRSTGVDDRPEAPSQTGAPGRSGTLTPRTGAPS